MTQFSNIEDYVTDTGIEMDGVDLSFGKDRFITVRRAGGANTAFTNHVANALTDDTAIGVANTKLDEDDARKVMYDAYSRFVVIDWRGWKDADGNEIPYSVENCIDLFNASREIYISVVNEANKLDNFRTQQVVDSGKE